jgi:hypothetical protein
MAFLTLLAVFFLIAAVLLFWLSRVVHPGLMDDAILSIGFALTALGLSQVMSVGFSRATPILALLLAVRW